MKNKIFAVLTAAVVGVMSFAHGGTVWANALSGDICPGCGDYGIAPVVNAREIRYYSEYKECENKYEDHADVLAQYWVRTEWYCGDCDIHWEDWNPDGGPFWHCVYD